MSTSPVSFDWIRCLVEEQAGNVLEDGKNYLVESRLAPIVESEKVDSVDELVQRMRATFRPELERRCIEAILTHESSFFRDPHYFDELATNILPQLIDRRRASRRLTIWCAASAAGQEPYSLAILLHEHFPEVIAEWHVEFVASDFARPVITQAQNGDYSDVEIQRGLSSQRIARFFRQSGNRWAADVALRGMIRFRESNLVTDEPPVPRADLILLRNVLIYMSEETRLQVVRKVRQALAPDGHLMLGATETLFDLDSGLDKSSGQIPTYVRSSD